MTTTKRTSVSQTAKIIDNHMAKTNIQQNSDVSSVANVEEENISLQTRAFKFGKLINEHGGSANGAKVKKKAAKYQSKRAAKPRPTARRVKKLTSVIPTPGEPDTREAISGRLSLRKRCKTPRDEVASEVTIRPLAELPEAYGVAEVVRCVSRPYLLFPFCHHSNLII
jgi:hypothetical protein